MDSIVIFIFGFMMVIAGLATLWYLIQTLRIMWSYSSLLAILAFLFSPIVHIVFYLIPKDGFGGHEKLMFKRYFLSIFSLAALGFLAAILIPATQESQDKEMVSEVDTAEPWDWDIRAENQEETLVAADTNADDEEIARLHFEAIYQAHPDANEIVESSDFADWQQGKSEVEQGDITRILKEGIASEVIYVLTSFKKDLADSRAYEYQAKLDNAQALAQREQREKIHRDLVASSQRNVSQLHLSTQAATQYPEQQELAKQSLTHSERQERDQLRASLSTPQQGANGGLTKAQREALSALDGVQPTPRNTGGAMPASTPTPSNIASCDTAGCWDTNGTRYNKGAGDTYFPSTGGVCQNVGGQMQCN